MTNARLVAWGRGRCAVLMLVAIAGMAAGAHGQVQWRSGAASPNVDPARVTEVLLLERAKAGHLFVKLARPIDDAGRAMLGALGLEVLTPLGDFSHMATLRGDADVAGLAASGWLLGAAPVRADWKVHPDLLAGLTPSWIMLDQADDPRVALYVTLHDDVAAKDAGARLVGALGGEVVGFMMSVNSMVVHVPLSAVMNLAAQDEVLWVEPASPQLQELNAENRALTGANVVNAAPYNLDGAGVTVLVFDGGSARATHVDFQGRVTVIDGSGVASHATHVAGTIGGAGVFTANNRGMAPGVSILSAAVNISGVSGWLYSNPCDIEADYTSAYNLGAHLANNSIGTNVNTNNFPCSWEGDYNTTDAVIDSIVRGSSAVTNNNPFRIVWAAGNERQGSARCGATYNTIGPPAGAKNHLSIGALNANNDSMTSFSGWGPTDDGRMKPDFCAPGCQSGGDNGVTSTTSASDTSYGVSCGTSMAAPTTTGLSALFLQDWRAQFPGQPDPRNSTLKAFYAQTAVDLGNTGPDYTFGYGSIRIQAAIDAMRTGQFRQDTVSQGFDQFYTVTVAPGTPTLSLTLAWDDAPGAALVIPSLVNDLDLEVFAPGGAQAFPWTLDPANPANDALQTQRNTRDNLEQVRVANPAAGVWQVRVKAFAVPVGPQVFSIVSSSPIAGGTPFPSVSITSASSPAAVLPLQSTPVSATVVVENDTLVANSVRVYYRAANAGPFSSVIMTNTSGNVWSATLPGFACDATPQFYYAVQGTASGLRTLPAGGASAPYATQVGELTTFFADDMETATAWVVGPNTATSGLWNRMDPQGTAAQPEDDTTPSPGINCWVTDGNAGASVGANDVDGGYTTLTSPPINLLGQPDAIITYSRWYSNTAGSAPNADIFTVQISGDGSTWLPLEVVGPTGSQTSGGWYFPSFRVGDFLTPTATVRLRFIADDAASGSIVEAAVDDLVVRRWVCDQPACSGDVNCDGATNGVDVEVQELAVGGDLSDYCLPDADFNGDGAVNGTDVEAVELVVGGGPCP
ncbi:MAG: hypothetical protein HBSAPP03_30060 [Phycisphaerae bacterium]|nr:MAG: hypothetical protein HBSAPP03_30060 [Phycisphaerae bacterium]